MHMIYAFGGFALDPRERVLRRGAARIVLRRRSFDVLALLVAHAGRLLERQTFLRDVWGGLAISEGVLKVAVSELRSALRDGVKRPTFIETVPGSGYRFIAPVVRHPAGADPRPSEVARAPRAAPPNAPLVGRDAELGALRAAIAGQVRVVYLHGIGGIGKTSLLAALVSGDADGASFAVVDGRDTGCLPSDFEGAVAAALGAPTAGLVAALHRDGGRTVLVVDAYEHVAPLDRWIREELLPRLPATTLLVLAGRLPPSPEWRSMPGWNGVLLPLVLGELDATAAREVLRARGVQRRHDEDALRFAHGHPLALCLVADLVARRPDAPLHPDNAPDVVQALLSRVVKDVDDDRHQAALDACSVVRHATEPLLEAMLGGGDARSLVRWLAQRSFMETARGGIRPHDLARDVLFADLKWRNVDRVKELVSRASTYLAKRLRVSRTLHEIRLADELLFLHSHHPVIGGFTRWRGGDGYVVEPAKPCDVGALEAIVARHEGPSAAAIAGMWLRAQLDGVLVVRDGSPTPAGFEITLHLERATEPQIAADPAAAQALRHVDAKGGRRAHHALLLHRFIMTRDTYQMNSPVQSILGSQCMRGYLTTPRLDWTFTCMSEPEVWAPILKAAFGAEALPAFEDHGRRYGLFFHCFRDLAPGAWLAELASRTVTGEESLAAPCRVLDRAELCAAVRDGFRALSRPGALEENALLESSLIAAGSAAEDRSGAVSALLLQTAELLRSMPRAAKSYAALRRAYLASGRSAEAREAVPASTHRRHLQRGIDEIVELLWNQQRRGAPANPRSVSAQERAETPTNPRAATLHQD